MKTKHIKTEKDFDTVKTFRAIKEKIAKETEGMNFKPLKAYLSKRKLAAAK